MAESVNLMGSSGVQESEKEILPVDVKDEDEIDIPEDINESDKKKFSLNVEGVKVWMYVLGAAVIVFVVVFILLSRQTSLFRGQLSSDIPPDAEDNVFESFSASASLDEFGLGDGEPVVDEGVVADEDLEGLDDDASDEGVVGDTGDLTDEELAALLGLEDDGAALDDLDTDEPVVGDESVFDEGSDFGFAADPDAGTLGSGDGTTATGDPDAGTLPDPGDTTSTGGAVPSLESSTDVTVVQSPLVQGDTGPNLLFALVPSFMYALARKRKRK